MRYYSLLLITILFANVNSMIAQYELDYELAVGDEFLLEQVAIQDMEMDMETFTQMVTNEISGVYTFKVTEISEEGYRIDSSFKSFSMKSSSNGITLMEATTTETPSEDDIMSKMFMGLVNKTIQIHMDKNGKILSLKGTDQLIDAMIDSAEIEDEATRTMMKEGMKGEFGNESLSKSFEQITYLFADKKLEIGDSWNNHYSGALEADNTFTLKKYAEEGIDITGIADVKLKNDDNDIKMILSGTQETTATLDTQTRFLRTATIIQKTEGVSTLKSMGGQEIPTKITSTITYKRL